MNIKAAIKKYKAQHHLDNKDKHNAESAVRRAAPGYKEQRKIYNKNYRATRNHVLVAYRKTPIHKYHTHKQGAKRRGIPFKLTFNQWLEIWESSGYLEEMGTKRGQYCMARYKDKGAYTIGNVSIQLSTDNISDRHKYAAESKKCQ